MRGVDSRGKAGFVRALPHRAPMGYVYVPPICSGRIAKTARDASAEGVPQGRRHEPAKPGWGVRMTHRRTGLLNCAETHAKLKAGRIVRPRIRRTPNRIGGGGRGEVNGHPSLHGVRPTVEAAPIASRRKPFFFPALSGDGHQGKRGRRPAGNAIPACYIGREAFAKGPGGLPASSYEGTPRPIPRNRRIEATGGAETHAKY